MKRSTVRRLRDRKCLPPQVEIDINDDYTYSPEVVLKFGTKASAPLIYPNPVDAVINIVAGQEAIIEIDLYDVSGRVLEAAAQWVGFVPTCDPRRQPGSRCLFRDDRNAYPTIYKKDRQTVTKKHINATRHTKRKKRPSHK